MPSTPQLPLVFRSTFRAPRPGHRPDAVPAGDHADAAGRTPELESLELELPASQPDAPARESDAPQHEPAPEPAPEHEHAPAPAPGSGAPQPEPAQPEPESGEPTADDGANAARELSRRAPRHRAERVRNRRVPGESFRRTMALGCVSAIMSVSALGAVAASADDKGVRATANVTGTMTTVAPGTADAEGDTPDTADSIAAPDVEDAPVEEPSVTGDLSVTSAPFTGGTQVTVTGEELDQVASVTVGDAPAPIVAADESKVTFAVPAVAHTAQGTSAEARFADAAGQPVDTEMPAPVVAEGTSVVQPLEGELTGTPEADVPMTPRTLSLTFTSDPGIDAQIAYVMTYWSNYNSGAYPVIKGFDCANFASQSLIARGWTMDAAWGADRATGAMSPSWASSTALRDYLTSRPDDATPLDDSQRDLVKVGDIAQFDWNSSGDRDHTAVVTRVEHTDAGTKVWVGGHTKDVDYWDVDTALATGGGSVSYFSIH